MLIKRFLPKLFHSDASIKGWCSSEQEMIQWLEYEVLTPFVNVLMKEIEEVISIDPGQSEEHILQRVTEKMVNLLGAQSGSVRIFDPHTQQLLSYGSYPSEEYIRERYVPVEGTIAGEVLKTRRPYVVSDILKEEKFQNKEIAFRKKAFSLIAIPFEIPKFQPDERETFGVIQIYFQEKDRRFTDLEVIIANLVAKRLSFVMAQRKIYLLHKAQEKSKLVSDIIIKASGMKGGLKIKEVFREVIAQLKDIIEVQVSGLLSVDNNMQSVVVEVCYPDGSWVHPTGSSYSIDEDECIQTLLNLKIYTGQSIYETITPWYIYVADTANSSLLSSKIKEFAKTNNINSILYIPLNLDSTSPYILLFATKEQRIRYTKDEIEILLHIGRELVKAQRMERLDDALHDFKNPAIAIAGFARRLKRLAERDMVANREQILKYAEILMEETQRLQELALSIYQVGNEELVNLTEILKKRFEINREAINQQLRQNIHLKEGPFDPSLYVLCHTLNLERVFDNVLNNATKAIPLEGGVLAIKTYREGEWACAEIRNTGSIAPEELMSLRLGHGSGRGLYITYRIVKMMNGRMEVNTESGLTTFRLMFPNRSLDCEEQGPK